MDGWMDGWMVESQLTQRHNWRARTQTPRGVLGLNHQPWRLKELIDTIFSRDFVVSV